MRVFMSSSEFNETHVFLAAVKRIMSFCNHFTLRFVIYYLKYIRIVGLAVL